MRTIEHEMEIGTGSSYKTAEAVYTNGAFSKSVANITLDLPLDSDVPKGASVTGITQSASEVMGKTYQDYKKGERSLLIQYNVNYVQKNYMECQVGANPSPNIFGCKYLEFFEHRSRSEPAMVR